MNENANVAIYADDRSIFFTAKECNAATKAANATLSALETWTDDSALSINTIVCPKSKPIYFTEEITLNGAKIKDVNHFKPLGVIVSANMFWDQHVQGLSDKECQ